MSGIEIGRVTIIKRLDVDGTTEVINTCYSDGLTLIDALGMLTFALAYTPPAFDTDDEPLS